MKLYVFGRVRFSFYRKDWFLSKRNGDRFVDRIFCGHMTLGPLTLYGANAMHWAINLSTPWGYLCVHPTTRTFGARWPWYVYLSRDATNSGASWGIGPGYRGKR